MRSSFSCSRAAHRSACIHTPCVGLVYYLCASLQVSARASAFGVRLVATRSRVPSTPPPTGFAWVGGADAVDRLLEESDYVVSNAHFVCACVLKGVIFHMGD